MIAWLHFNRGDYLLFQAWQPSSDGAIVGANIAIFTFSVIDRWLASWRRYQEYRWRISARARVLGNQPESNGQRVEGVTAVPDQQGASPTAVGLVPPFIPSHDIPRGVFHIVQTTMSYALMLVIMTFNAGFLISAVLGLGVGEIFFGRVERLHDANTAI